MRLATLGAWVILGCVNAIAQPANPTFDVASVKRSAPIQPGQRGVFFGPPRGGPGTADPSQITWTYATLKRILLIAYDLNIYQVNGPDWLDTERYDIVVKIPSGATNEQVAMMWQNLLTERFLMQLHHEPKEFQVEELVVMKGGHKLTETQIESAAMLDPGPPKFDNGKLTGPGFVTTIMLRTEGPRAHSTAKAQPLSPLVTMLSTQLNRPVLDKTGLSGRYDFEIEFAPNLQGVQMPPPPPGTDPSGVVAPTASDPGPDLPSAIQKQLGLRLVSSRAKLDVIVIDKAEKVPTEN